MNNETTHRGPVTALRRCESSLEALQHRITELEADLSVISGVIQRLERIAGLVRADEERRNRERREHVREEPFYYDLNHPEGDQ